MTYEQGFAAGERQGFEDRTLGRLKPRPQQPIGNWAHGFWDAYLPRSTAWATRPLARVSLESEKEPA